MRALLLSMLGVMLSLFASFMRQTQFSSFGFDCRFCGGGSCLVVYSIAQIRFRKEWLKEHNEEELASKLLQSFLALLR